MIILFYVFDRTMGMYSWILISIQPTFQMSGKTVCLNINCSGEYFFFFFGRFPKIYSLYQLEKKSVEIVWVSLKSFPISVNSIL